VSQATMRRLEPRLFVPVSPVPPVPGFTAVLVGAFLGLTRSSYYTSREFGPLPAGLSGKERQFGWLTKRPSQLPCLLQFPLGRGAGRPRGGRGPPPAGGGRPRDQGTHGMIRGCLASLKNCFTCQASWRGVAAKDV